jgi:hypothetical protein
MFFYWPALEPGIPGVDWPHSTEDLYGLDGLLEDLEVFRGYGEWGVSTLRINPIHNEPYVTLFRSESEALMYARLRALRSGSPRRTEKGRVMFVLHYPPSYSRTPQGDIKYRVLRGQRGSRQAPGQTTHLFGERQEQILVFRLAGTLPTGQPHWVMAKGLSVNVRDLEKEYEEARLAKGRKKITRWERTGDPE